MCDLVSKMLDERCLQEVFIYNVMYKKDQLRIVFDRLAHSSIMRLNTNSMDKVWLSRVWLMETVVMIKIAILYFPNYQ